MASSIDPIGLGSYMGQAVPLYGESVIRQQNSSNAVLTLMQTSGAGGSTGSTGRIMLGLDYKDIDSNVASSVLTNLAVFDIDSDGGYRLVSGTTVIMELNSSGLYAGTTLVVNTSGELQAFKQATVTLAATSQALVSSNSGKLHIVSSNIGSTVQIALPTSATGAADAGMYWDIFCNSTAAAVVDITIVGANTGGSILNHIGTTNAVATTGAITHDTSGPFWVRVYCLSTGATPTYSVSNFLGRNGATTASYFGFSAGATALT